MLSDNDDDGSSPLPAAVPLVVVPGASSSFPLSTWRYAHSDLWGNAAFHWISLKWT